MPLDPTGARRAQGTPGLLEQLGRRLQTICYCDGLHPVQWSALRFFAHCHPPAGTVSGLAAFQGTTLAPASRTVATLRKKDLLVSDLDPSDRRSRRINVTDKGRALLERDPLHDLTQILNGLAQEEQRKIATSLERLLFLTACLAEESSGAERKGQWESDEG